MSYMIDLARMSRYIMLKSLGKLPKIQPDAIYKNGKQAKGKLLFLAWFDPNGLGTIQETIGELIRLSVYSIDLLNLYTCLSLSEEVTLADYDGIIVHNTLSYNVDNLMQIDYFCKNKLKEYRGLKVMMKQDEHYQTHKTTAYLGEMGFDLLVTLCNEETAPLFYPHETVPNLKFMQFLTGYVPEAFYRLPYTVNDERPIDIGYRGSIQPAQFGRLAYEKRMIGEWFRPIATEQGLTTDISSLWEDRYMGGAWLSFLSRCKATLGVESGSTIVDLDGRIELQFHDFQKKHPKASDEDILTFLAPFEKKGLEYRAISPRHFEAAACRSVQILFEGDYQGIFEPNRHYLPLKRDFSNAQEIVSKLKDKIIRTKLTETAFDEIILNPAYSYKNFVMRLDEQLDHLFAFQPK